MQVKGAFSESWSSAPFASLLSPLNFLLLQTYKGFGVQADRVTSSPTFSLRGGGVALCSDPAKITPHYPNETLAWPVPSLAQHRPPHKVSSVFCAVPGESTEGEDIVVAAHFA